LNQRTAKVVVGTVRTFHEAAGPCRVIWIALARADVPFDLAVDGGLGLGHLDTSIIRIEIQLPGMDAFSKPMRLSNWRCSGPGGGRGLFCAFVWRRSPGWRSAGESGRLKHHHAEAPTEILLTSAPTTLYLVDSTRAEIPRKMN
jgi:hypothetical protein